jgi:hypothetical protein
MFLSLIVALSGRENPFKPAASSSTPATIDPHEKIEILKEVRFKLPDTAREMLELKVVYKNIDSSVGTKSIKINRSIDWHKEFIFTQKCKPKPKKKPKIKDNNSTKTDSNETNSTKVAKIKPKINEINYKPISFIKFRVKDYKIYIYTDDKLKRDLLLPSPCKVVLDFIKPKNSFYTIRKKFKTPPLKEIAVASHNGYYRAAIELDGTYRYKLKKSSFGYIVELY